MELLGPPWNVAWDLSHGLFGNFYMLRAKARATGESHGVVGTSTECSMGFIPWVFWKFLLSTG
ncbi:hypothetical protein [Aliiglaciecola lipolytica]|uniref:hypothetical protein n=1 Tax=Aliiglaciecola lipolytica TaxID=477689 RepID=UPI00058E962E|nr:hypothetical protein [Aliiglaciecola lipolytica]